MARDGTRLPPSALTAAVIHLPGATGAVSLESLQVTDSQVSVVVADTAAVRATGTISIGQTQGFLELTDAFGRPSGGLFGDLQILLKMKAGIYLFDPKTAEFVPACLLPVPDTQVAGIQTPRSHNDVRGPRTTRRVWSPLKLRPDHLLCGGRRGGRSVLPSKAMRRPV